MLEEGVRSGKSKKERDCSQASHNEEKLKKFVERARETET